MKITAGIIAALSLWYAYQGTRKPDLAYFKPEEFGPYWALMHPDLLVKLDAFRRELGYPVMISPAPGGIGRPVIGEGNTEDEVSNSWHNYLRHGWVMAIDVMPIPPTGEATKADRERWARVAQAVGFTGVGVYPHWRPRSGVHLDIRTDRGDRGALVWTGLPDGKGGQVYDYTGVTA